MKRLRIDVIHCSHCRLMCGCSRGSLYFTAVKVSHWQLRLPGAEPHGCHCQTAVCVKAPPVCVFKEMHARKYLSDQMSTHNSSLQTLNDHIHILSATQTNTISTKKGLQVAKLIHIQWMSLVSQVHFHNAVFLLTWILLPLLVVPAPASVSMCSFKMYPADWFCFPHLTRFVY